MAVAFSVGSVSDHVDRSAIATVTVFAGLPAIGVLASTARAGTFEWVSLLGTGLAVWVALPSLFVVIADVPRSRWLRMAVTLGVVGALPFLALSGLVLALGRSADPWDYVWSSAQTWLLLWVSSLAIAGLWAVLASALGKVEFRPIDDLPESWPKAFGLGAVAGLLVGGMWWWLSGDLVQTAFVASLSISLLMVAWLLERCPPFEVLRRLVVLAVPALVVLLIEPVPSALTILVVGFVYAAALGVTCSRSMPNLNV